MIKDSFRKLRSSRNETSVSVEDVQRIRRQRRHAQTEAEHADVRVYMRDLAGDLKGKPRSNATYLKNIGIALIVIGLIMGSVLFYVAYLTWPSYLEFLDS